jgi:hypothetical protein
MNKFARFAAIPLAMLLAAATPTQKIIPRPTGGPALINPAESPIEFQGFDKEGTARFHGRFVLSGYFTYGCEFDCQGASITEQDLVFRIMPDPDLAKRLPRWTNSGDLAIDIRQMEKMKSRIATKEQVRALLSGSIVDVHGHIAILVDDFVADFGCDYSPNYSARFVAVAAPPKPAEAQSTPGGC